MDFGAAERGTFNEVFFQASAEESLLIGQNKVWVCAKKRFYFLPLLFEKTPNPQQTQQISKRKHHTQLGRTSRSLKEAWHDQVEINLKKILSLVFFKFSWNCVWLLFLPVQPKVALFLNNPPVRKKEIWIPCRSEKNSPQKDVVEEGKRASEKEKKKGSCEKTNKKWRL